jgi:hypothetical protein
MTNIEIQETIHHLRMSRQDYIIEFMKEYDKKMYLEIAKLREQCTHDRVIPRDNGIGHYWSECIYCGKAIEYEN